jgi:hypothetical protein
MTKHISIFQWLIVWQTTHNQLLKDDPYYRKRFWSFLYTVLGISCVLWCFYLPYFGVRLFGFVIDVCITLGLAFLLVVLTIRQLIFQKKSIDRKLALLGKN